MQAAKHPVLSLSKVFIWHATDDEYSYAIS
jgi:hypothetical protein